MITGKILKVKISKTSIAVASRFGSISVPKPAMKKAEEEKKIKKLMGDIVPKCEFLGTEKSGKSETYFFRAPDNWKGGVNA